MNYNSIGARPASRTQLKQALAFILGVTTLAIVAYILNH